MIQPNKFRDMLISLFESKCKQWTNNTIEVWYQELKNFDENKIGLAFKKLIQGKDDFISVGKILAMINEDSENKKIKIAENAWKEVLSSAKCGGFKKISARAGKALNSMGGMDWLRNADPAEVNWQRKEFLEIYENTPDPIDNNFECPGLQVPMYLEEKEEQKLIGG
jgi:hypothetical protein